MRSSCEDSGSVGTWKSALVDWLDNTASGVCESIIQTSLLFKLGGCGGIAGLS